MALMTTAQAAEILSVSPTTIRNMIKAGVLPAVKIMSEYRIDRDDVTAYINANRTTRI